MSNTWRGQGEKEEGEIRGGIRVGRSSRVPSWLNGCHARLDWDWARRTDANVPRTASGVNGGVRMPFAPCSAAAAAMLTVRTSLDAYANVREELSCEHICERTPDSPSNTICERSSASSSSSRLALRRCARARSSGEMTGRWSTAGAGKQTAEGVLSEGPF